MSAPNARHLIGVDVGTGSARAGVFDLTGQLLGTDHHPITLFREEGSVVEQSSDEIWAAVGRSVQGALKAAGLSASDIAGIGFDATCSLVVLDPEGRPLPVGPSNDPARNVIVWMDHRATAQTERINATKHRVLDYVGGRISPEMETPKLLWLKEHRRADFDAAGHFFDLTDFLTWKATGSGARSICTVTCKWTYMGHESRWDESYFRQIGLSELADEGFARIGTEVVMPGTALGAGLTEAAARDLGLLPGTPVAAGLIDAHAGGVGTVGAAGEGGAVANLAYVFGTSSCTMTTTEEPVFVPGVWGPYYSAMVPGGLAQRRRSVCRRGCDRSASAVPSRLRRGLDRGFPCRAFPPRLAQRARRGLGGGAGGDAARLADGLHVVPEFLGNRAPHADPYTRAIIAGLGMEDDIDNLVALYIAGICGLGYGLRQIIEVQAKRGASVSTIVISGGAGRSDLVRQILADATGVTVAAPQTEEPVLLGSAILARWPGAAPDVATAMAQMSRIARRYAPGGEETRAYHDARFALFEKFQALARDAALREA
ncbi:FGGY-family carbohydrate kinase [Rhodobacter capsulatus]|uniref:FGGY-family carbohydrate kinase n=1 Tax=Rhodobacter capsulatus TaxID=1061 RepID=UPI0040294577